MSFRHNRPGAMILGTVLVLLAYAFFAWFERQRGHDWTADPPRFGPAPGSK